MTAAHAGASHAAVALVLVVRCAESFIEPKGTEVNDRSLDFQRRCGCRGGSDAKIRSKPERCVIVDDGFVAKSIDKSFWIRRLVRCYALRVRIEAIERIAAEQLGEKLGVGCGAVENFCAFPVH